jgi:hypothetical protein
MILIRCFVFVWRIGQEILSNRIMQKQKKGKWEPEDDIFDDLLLTWGGGGCKRDTNALKQVGAFRFLASSGLSGKAGVAKAWRLSAVVIKPHSVPTKLPALGFLPVGAASRCHWGEIITMVHFRTIKLPALYASYP